MAQRPHNFNAGPAILPLEVLEEAREAIVDTHGTGLSILEWSHRSPEYGQVHEEAVTTLRELLGPSAEGHEILFLQGGASLQFAQVPLNLAAAGRPGEYVVTGVWAEKALAEARRLGRGRELWNGGGGGFSTLPAVEEIRAAENCAYVHLTSNNTIYGTQWRDFPRNLSAPLVADMSSDMLSRPLDLSAFHLIYAGAQKNLGPAGLAVVLIEKEVLERCATDLPNILSYRAHAGARGLYHTPPTFAVYLMGLVFRWMLDQGGLVEMGRRSEARASLLYEVIDASDFYSGTAAPSVRSRMNVTFRLPSEELERLFLEESAAEGFVGLKGHRLVGGLRASIYNAMPEASVRALADFMRAFEARHG